MSFAGTEGVDMSVDECRARLSVDASGLWAKAVFRVFERKSAVKVQISLRLYYKLLRTLDACRMRKIRW